MDVKELPQIVLMLVLIGMIVGIGVLIHDKFGTATAVTATVTNESITIPAVGVNVSLAQENLTGFSRILNATGGTQLAANYTVHLTDGIITHDGNTSACTQGDTCYAYYSWTNYDSETRTALRAAQSAISGVATSWLALIVTMVVLGILLTMVINSFRMKR